MAKTVKIPGIGTVPTKYAVAGGLAVVVIAGVAWWRYAANRQAIEEAAAAAPTVVDATGDLGDETVYPAYSTDYAPDQSYDGGAYPYPTFTTPSYGVTTTVQTPEPTTNSEWTRRSIEHLEMVGVESGAASLAVSRYLLKECLTATQADIVRQAVAAVSTPPQGEYSIIVCPSGSPGDGTEQPSPGFPSGATLPAPSGLHVMRTFRTEIQIGWNPVKDAAGYAVFRSEPASASSTWQRQTTSVYPSFQFKGLRPGTRYQFRIQTVGHDNRPGGAAVISASTKK